MIVALHLFLRFEPRESLWWELGRGFRVVLQSSRIHVRLLTHSHEYVSSSRYSDHPVIFPVTIHLALPHFFSLPPSVLSLFVPRHSSSSLVSHSFRKKSSLVIRPRRGFRLRCATANRPATCWLEGKSHLFRFSSKRSLCGEARSLGAPGAWLISCVTCIMHVLRHRWALGVHPLPE